MITWTWHDLMEQKPRRKLTEKAYAYCGSWRCAKSRALVKKEIEGHPTWCPDCGCSLVWRFENKKVINIWNK
jgi:hypothetical protein